LEQLEQVLKSKPSGHWAIATSRRTPADFVAQLQSLLSDRIRLVPAESVGPEWLPQQFARCGEVWVTGESVSMLYEAVTSGAAVGMLELPRTRSNKATRCIDMLLDRNAVTSFTNYMADGVLTASDLPLNEADRCAWELLSRQIVPQITSAGPSTKVA
jgi:mitochondrial fission protein ELM1